MTPLGRGLSSLIPRRGRGDAESIIEQIDSMEEVENEAPENVKRYRESMERQEESGSGARKLSITEEEDSDVEDVESVQEDDVFEDDSAVETESGDSDEVEVEMDPEESEEDEDQEITMPKRPLVTPLTPDAEPAEEDEVLVNTEEEKVEDELDEDDSEDDDADDVVEKTEDVEPVIEKEESLEEETDDAEEVKRAVVAEEKKAEKGRMMEDEKMPKAMQERMLGETVEYVPLGDIEVNPLQPRRTFDVEDLDDLVQSLEQHGMLQPIVVTPKVDGKGYQLVAGERRLRASKLLKWDTVPAVVRKSIAGDRNRLELALIENVQRQNLNPIEEAMGYLRLNEEYGMTHEEIGQRVGRSRVGITNIIRILQLPAEIQRGLIEGKIAIGHARAILMIPDEEKQLRFYQHVVDEGLTVRKTENRARRIQRNMNLTDPMRQKMRNRPSLGIKYDGLLQDKYGCNVRVKFDNTKNRFEVVFYAYSEDEASDIVKMLTGEKPLPQGVDADVMEE